MERAAYAAQLPFGRPCFVNRRFVPLPRSFPIGRWFDLTCALQTWQRLTLPRLETKYHQRWSVSRPSSEWDRVQPLRHNHQVGKTHVVREALRSEERSRASNSGAVGVPLGAVSACHMSVMSIRNENDQAYRTISTGKLHALPHFHTRPINVVVFHGSQGILVLR